MQVFTEFSLLNEVNQICNPAGAEPIRRHQQKNGGCASLDAPTNNRNILEISNRHHFLIGFLPFLAPPIFMERMAQPRLPPR